MKKHFLILIAAVVAGATGAMADSVYGINMDFKSINGANSADTTTYGAVGYNYRIGTYEVSVDQFQAATGAGDGDEGYWAAGTRLNSGSAPASYVSFVEAAMFCNFMTSGNITNGAYTIAGGQVTDIMTRSEIISDGGLFYVLPTEDEWYKAAYYKDDYSLYADGSSTLPNQTAANYSASSAWVIGDGAEEQNFTKNMMGNVWEWTESAHDGTLELPVDENILFRGGAYNATSSWLASTERASDTETLEHPSVGMRVVAIPEPGTISFMSLSTVGLFLTRTMRRRKRLGQTLVPVRREHLCDTFGEAQHMDAALEEEGPDYLLLILSVAKEGCLNVWTSVRDTYTAADRNFWDSMVARHERKVARRIAFRQACRKKALDGLDTFLARIMK